MPSIQNPGLDLQALLWKNIKRLCIWLGLMCMVAFVSTLVLVFIACSARNRSRFKD